MKKELKVRPLKGVEKMVSDEGDVHGYSCWNDCGWGHRNYFVATAVGCRNRVGGYPAAWSSWFY